MVNIIADKPSETLGAAGTYERGEIAVANSQAEEHAAGEEMSAQSKFQERVSTLHVLAKKMLG